MSFKNHLDEMLKDEEFSREFKRLEPEYEIVRAMIQGRSEKGMTQKELSRATGIQQAQISRLENANYNPSIAMLKRIAAGLGKEVHIEFR
ncbi:MAG: helix-turn-helix transcriptional regulator [Clostridiales Family XIII bacterium]|jgi:predicted transcriptional regulator|nr:helix-turn-helix transcriptional regulator [Clostridiales Family XIII bacterium]